MSSRKRQAEPLETTRNPKHRRLSLSGRIDNSWSPPEVETLGGRWLEFGREFWVLVAATFWSVLPSPSPSTRNEEADSDSSTSQLPSEPMDTASTTSTTPRQLSPTRPPQVTSTSTPVTQPISPPMSATDPPPRATSSAIRPEDIPLPPSPMKLSSHSRTPSHPTNMPISFHPDPRMHSTPGATPVSLATPRTTPPSSPTPTPTRTPAQLPTPPSTDTELQHSVVPRMRELQLGQHPPPQTSQPPSVLSDSQMDLGSQTSRHPSQPSKRDYHKFRKRDHIFAKVHKANVKRQRVEQRETIILEIYLTKRKAGYTSGLEDLKNLLDYEQELEKHVIRDIPHPKRLIRSSALGGKVRGGRRKPDFESEFSRDEFLQRALDNAKATLNSPPPKPFFPKLEELSNVLLRKNEAIDRLLRPIVPPLPTSLPPEDEKNVKEIMQKRGVVAKFAKEQVSHTDLSRLLPGQWLNDEIINFYGAMLLARSEGAKENPTPEAKGKRAVRGPLNAHYFSSFFWSKLVSEGYEKGRLAKWTKRIDIFSKDVVFMPVNHGNAHWTTAAINFRQKRFESYDSMGMAKGHVFRKLREYITLEHRNKKKKEFDFGGWEDWAPDSTPQQENGYDCGVFTCQFMEAISRGEENFNFSQQDMPYLRRRMIWEIGNAKLRDDR